MPGAWSRAGIWDIPWLARRMPPTRLPESAANSSAPSRARAVASAIISDFRHGRLAQSGDGRDGAWVHAYLHRVEGDPGNAAYRYRCAGRPMPDRPPRQERPGIVATLLAGDRS